MFLESLDLHGKKIGVPGGRQRYMGHNIYRY